MGSKRNMWLSIILAAVILLLASCDTVTVHRRPGRGHGPPAHAQAHGYRRKVVHGYELIYDSGTGLYVVVGMTDCYYCDGYFYRLRGDVWEISLRADDWGPVDHDRLPPGLRVKTKSVAKVNGNGKSLVKLNGNGNNVVKLNGKGKH